MITLADVQRYIGVEPDGLFGPRTLAAIAKALGIEGHNRVMSEPDVFFDDVRDITEGLDQTQVDVINMLLEDVGHWPTSWLAYGLATGWHEAYLRPIKEKGGNSYFHQMYDIQGKRPRIAKALGNVNPGDGIKYAGRGLVQLTGRTNYWNASERFGVDFIEYPDRVLELEWAVKIMVWGMETGAFTGVSLSAFLSRDFEEHPSFRKARAIINGSDKANLIADYALEFQSAAITGGWK